MLRKDKNSVMDTTPVYSDRDERPEIATTLGPDTTFKGTMTFEKPLKVDGTFEGELHTNGYLIVGKSGQVKADLNVGETRIEGKVSGNVNAERRVDLAPTAVLHGDIKANRLAIAEGATFVGHCDVNPARKAERPAPKPAPAFQQKEIQVAPAGA
jgi:cytoskeletal protein CcmA (bactofilin family)